MGKRWSVSLKIQQTPAMKDHFILTIFAAVIILQREIQSAEGWILEGRTE
jgi:hypothetical protein